MESQDKRFMRLVSRLPDASQRPERYQLMSEFLAVYTADADVSASPEDAVEPEPADPMGEAMELTLNYLTRLVAGLEDRRADDETALAMADTLERAATGLIHISAVMGFVEQVGDAVPFTLATMAAEVRAEVDAWRASQVPAPERPDQALAP